MTTKKNKAVAESVYQRAAALWVAKKTGKDADKITNVDFIVIRGGYCETCAYESTGVSYKYNGKYQEYELDGDFSMGGFLEEAVQLLAEAAATPLLLSRVGRAGQGECRQR